MLARLLVPIECPGQCGSQIKVDNLRPSTGHSDVIYADATCVTEGCKYKGHLWHVELPAVRLRQRHASNTC